MFSFRIFTKKHIVFLMVLLSLSSFISPVQASTKKAVVKKTKKSSTKKNKQHSQDGKAHKGAKAVIIAIVPGAGIFYLLKSAFSSKSD